MLVRNEKPTWAPKVSQAKIHLLYDRDARGITDMDLIDEVGWALWARCDSILIVTAAHHGRVQCLACDTVIERQNTESVDEIIECGKCGWRIPWSTYHQSYRNKQLFGANAVGIFESYHSVFPRAQTAREKMVLIDQLIHAFHTKLTDIIGRPVAANLLQGSLKEVIQFLDRLSSGDASAAGIGDSQTAWRQTLAAADWSQPFVENNDHPDKMVQE